INPASISRQRLAASCCQLTRPSLDKSYAECRQRLQLPRRRKYSVLELYAINRCVEECSYIASGYIEIDPPFVLDMDTVELNLNLTMPQPQNESVAFMLKAYALCQAFRELHPEKLAVNVPEFEFLQEDCDSFAMQMTVCVRVYAMQKCPPAFYANSSECRVAQRYFTRCVDDVEAEAM
ncbi:hypothetical protein KR222_007754, partial [Zaprionus bogoriensis]